MAVRVFIVAGLVTLFSTVGSSVAKAETRTWTDGTGKYKIEADFLEILEGQVKLQRTDGKKISIPLAKLSKDDQAYLRELLKQRRSGGVDTDSPFQESGDEDNAGVGSAEPATPRGFGQRAGFDNGRPKRRSPFSTGVNVGDKVEVREGFNWQAGVVAGLDPKWDKVFVKLNEDGRMVDVSDNEHFIRRFDASVVPVDLTSIRRVVPLGGQPGDFKPDPAQPSSLDWKPRPVGLNPKAGFFQKPVGVSFARGGTTAVVGHTGGAEPNDAQSRIEVCDLKTGRVTALLRGPEKLKLLAVSPSGQRLITISERGAFESGPLQLWELGPKELKLVRSWQVAGDAHRKDVNWIGWVDDQRIMTADNGGIFMWLAEGPKGVYQVAGQEMSAPAFSPGGKQFAIGTDKGYSIHEVESGELVSRIPLDHSFRRQVAFSPSGKLLAVTGSSTVEVYDLATGKKSVEAYAPAAQSNKGLTWVNEEHVLVGGSDLIHLPSQMTVWTYQHDAESVAPLAGRIWYVFGSHGNDAMALVPFQLPHAAVKPVADSELVLRPGDDVSLEMEQTVDLTRPQDANGPGESARDQLAKALAEAGFNVVLNSNKKLIGRTTTGETREIQYRRFGAPFGQVEKASYTQRIFELELTVDGTTVWQRRRVIDAPFHLQLQKDESVDQAVERVMSADTGFFRSTIPSRVLPTEAEKARTSKLSVDGIN
jgi:hypothetical protein